MNYFHIQRNDYFIQRIIYIFNERIIFIQPIKYIYSRNEFKYFYPTR